MKQFIIQLLNNVRVATRSNELSGKVVLVTGATGGLGKAVVNELTNKGAQVVVVGRDKSKLKALFENLSTVTILQGNVSKEADVASIMRAIESKYKKLDVLVNCVGAFSDGDIATITGSEYEKVFDANFRSVLFTSQAAINLMRKKKTGTIINVGSRISRNSNMAPGKMLYAASKYALEGYSVALSKTVAKDNIRVICLLPATMSTFVTKDFYRYMIPDRVARVISFVVEMNDIDFDPIAFKSVCQNI